jgi:hypothetical protein
LQLLLTKPSKEIAGLIFILKNRHSKLFDAGRLKLDITSAGSPLQLTSPEVIERARLYARTIDAEVIDSKENILLLPVSASASSSSSGSNEVVVESRYDEYHRLKKEKDEVRAKAYMDSLIEGEMNDEEEQED